MDLRKLASHVSVKLPTTMKKDPLIDAIVDIVTGKTPPYQKIKKGRGTLEAKISDEVIAQYNHIRNLLDTRAPNAGAAEPEPEPVAPYECDEAAAPEVEVLPLDKVETVAPANAYEKPAVPYARPAYDRQGGYDRDRRNEYERRPDYRRNDYGRDNPYNNNAGSGGRDNSFNNPYNNNNTGNNDAYVRRNDYGRDNSFNHSGGAASYPETPVNPFYKRYEPAGRGDFNRQDPPVRNDPPEVREGVLEIHQNGFGFIRAKNYEPGDGDAFVRAEFIKSLGLRKGDWVKGTAFRQRAEGNVALSDNLFINGKPAAGFIRRPNFEDMTPIYPDKRLTMELADGKSPIAMRCVDLIAPIGKGQRGIIVSPPKAGKTTVLKQIAHSITVNNPDVHLIVLLIDERPEEVTDMQRSVKGEVVYSTFDEQPDHHTRAAELVLARAKRLVELGRDVVILLDSLTRLARAYNLTIEASGKTLSGGIDPAALHSPKRFFGAARNIENGGSLTIIATALVDTGSRMDEVIFEEFKGTGNMEIHLDRKLQEKRIFPAIDLNKSSTRREDLLLSQKELEGIYSIRRILSVGDTQEATEQLITMMVRTKTNMEFISGLPGWLKSLR
jgi:transcription termination factor Rho